MTRLSDFNKQCVFDCYKLMRDCVSFDHIEDSAFVYSVFEKINRYRVTLPPTLFRRIDEFVSETLYPIVEDQNFFSSTQSLEFGKINKDGIFEINSIESIDKIMIIMLQITTVLEFKVDSFAEQELKPYLI